MTKPKHTPLPWKLLNTTYRDGKELKIICGKNSSYIMIGGENKEENAALIVRAVNNHYQLLEACKGIEFLGVIKCPQGVNKEAWEHAFSQIRNAVINAEKEG